MNERILWIQRQLACSPHTKVTGDLGELVIVEALKSSESWFAHQPKRRKVGDLHVYSRLTGEQIKVEIKTAKRGKRGYQFCLRKHDKYGETTINHADVVLLLCVGLSGSFLPFVLPKSFFGDQQNATISNPYKGKYSPYRQTLRRLDFVFA